MGVRGESQDELSILFPRLVASSPRENHSPLQPWAPLKHCSETLNLLPRGPGLGFTLLARETYVCPSARDICGPSCWLLRSLGSDTSPGTRCPSAAVGVMERQVIFNSQNLGCSFFQARERQGRVGAKLYHILPVPWPFLCFAPGHAVWPWGVRILDRILLPMKAWRYRHLETARGLSWGQ